MSILPQSNHRMLSRPFRHVPCFPLPRSISCSLTTTTTAKSSPNQLLISEPQHLNSPTKLVSSGKHNDPSLQSTWSHRAWVATGCTNVLFSLANSITESATSHIWLEPLAAAWFGYLFADLGSGVYHWGIDNYGNASTPIFGSQIEAFQGHHKWPWTITRRQFANNIHALARAITFAVLPIDLICHDPVLLSFTGACSGCIMFSQQFHAWAHGTKSKLPPIVVALQDAGILVSRSQHLAHHRQPRRLKTHKKQYSSISVAIIYHCKTLLQPN